MTVLRSRDNPRIRRWSRLAREPRLRREEGRALLEGVHLVAAWLERHGPPAALIASESGLARAEIALLVRECGMAPVVLADGLFRAMVEVETPAGLAAEIRIPPESDALGESQRCVFLDGIQDAGNVGAILRSAAAFGVQDAVLSPGCADAWSPKALRAGMGGQFALRVSQDADLRRALERFGGRVLCTVVEGGRLLHEADLGGRTGWIFGAEGRGVAGELVALADVKVTIALAGKVESLNVAATAAICLYEGARREMEGHRRS